MGLYKCKMCGGTLETEENKYIVTCDYCGITQTIHSFDNEKKITLFKRANALRFKCEFDKAAAIYETIIDDFPKEAEAYWGLLLCKYGIEYVDDPKTGNKIPTCHRTEFSSILKDADYKNVIKYSDVVARDVYKEEAGEIDKLQKDILTESSKANPFDIFICYKETSDGGSRTEDSVIAESIYDELTSKGYSVFFSRITLESKLGGEYEPIIFAALHSSKVMVHVTTSGDNSDSVWVRNEWSRFVQLISSGQKKVLIPVYKGITPYELPTELQHLQGQDFSKIGAMQDLVRGIEKICGKKSINKEKILVSENDLFNKHLEQGKIYLSRGLWDNANDEFKSASKLSEKPGQAYLGLLFSNFKVKSIKTFCSKCINDDLFDNSFFKTFKNNVDDTVTDEYDQIINAVIAMEDKKALNDAIEKLYDGAWKEADEMISNYHHKENIQNDFNEVKLQYIKTKKDFKFTVYYFSRLNDLINICESCKDYLGVSDILQSLIDIKNAIIEENRIECEEKFKLNYPYKIDLPSLYDFSIKLRILKCKLNVFEFATEELKNTYTKTIYYEKWLNEQLIKYLKKYNSEVDVYIAKTIASRNSCKSSDLEKMLEELEFKNKSVKRKILGNNL